MAALLAGVLLAATASSAIARVQTKTCLRISSCAISGLAPPPLPTATQTPQPQGRFALKITTAPTSTPGTASNPGHLVVNPLLGRRITCPDYKLRSADTLAFQLLTATPLHITYVVTERIANTTKAGIQFCLAAPFAFKTLSGGQAPPTRLPDGTSGHVGLLPGCANTPATAPCLEPVTTVHDSASSTTVDVIVRVRVPVLTKVGDPWGGS
ncbi:MAG TPA: hypothetical protein VMA77_15150 [Solirubrobacteraceae bacterium]|nr:hypothetical protein [Solirubrobacteraceae bacterium]